MKRKPKSQGQSPQRQASEGRPRAQQRAGLLRPLLLVGLVAVAVYVSGIPGDFVFDDKLLQRDPRILGQTSFWTIFVTDYWYKYIGTSADLYRPLTIASYALNYQLAGLSSAAFHVVNILLHAVASGLVLTLIDALFSDRRLAVVAALLFATHPVHAEAVTGIVGRAEVLSALFLLAALNLHARGYALWGRERAVWLPVALAAYFCALLSKETAIVGPGLLLLIDYVGRATKGRASASADGWNLRRALPVVGMYVAVAILYLTIRFSIVGQFIQKPPPFSYLLLFGHPLTTRLWTAAEIFVIYLRLLFVPITLSADYSYRQVPLLAAPDLQAIVGICAALAFCVAFVWALRRRLFPALFALGFFAVAYSVVSNLLVPLQILVAERLMYLPSVGFCVGLAWVLLELSRRAANAFAGRAAQRLTVAVVGAVVLLYSVRTFVRNFDWRDNETLYAATVKAAPECFAAHFNYSAILLRNPEKQQLALQELLEAYAIRQDHYPSLVNLSSLYVGMGQAEKGRDIARRGLELRPEGKELKAILAAAEAQLQQQRR